MKEGNLNDIGALSARALCSVCTNQQLLAKFAYCDIRVPVDLSVYIFTATSADGSEGGNKDKKYGATCSSVFDGGVAVKVPLSIQPEFKLGAEEERDAMEIEQQQKSPVSFSESASMYWAYCRLLNATMTPEVSATAEADFVACRQQHSQNASSTLSSSSSYTFDSYQPQQADFSRWITVARLLAITKVVLMSRKGTGNVCKSSRRKD